ncbi:hypothetical protein BDZ91DRAFT_506769 [Kalaharituber pfeilii]|nr:hypothetical protein BDZ91DRAFT_506769 [Kalaharituber pfeilii]
MILTNIELGDVSCLPNMSPLTYERRRAITVGSLCMLWRYISLFYFFFFAANS